MNVVGIRERAEQLQDQLMTWRRHLHKHPERSFQEKETAAFVAQVLRRLPGMVVTEQVGGYGVVAELAGKQGKTVVLRADMDALPIEEQLPHSFASIKKGTMHACGHDAHTAILLGAATILSERHQAGYLNGTVRFLFQPAEEKMDEAGKTGAIYMIEAGAMAGADIAFALHMCPWLRPNAIQVHSGASMASFDAFKGTITGSGGHGAYPHLGVDAIWLLSQVLPAIYGLTGRFASPLEPAVISIGQIHGGKANNVIPEIVEVEGTIRCYNDDVRKKLTEEVSNAFAVANVFGGEGACTVKRGEPALVNDSEAIALIKQAAHHLYPNDRIVTGPYGLGSEDFAHMAKTTKAAMFFLGCQPRHGEFDLHTPQFQIDEACLSKGTALMAGVCADALNKKE